MSLYFRSFNVYNYFSLKDITLTLKANVVHFHKGSCDKTHSYIGKTKRYFDVRVQERFSGNQENLLFMYISVHVRTVALSATSLSYLKPMQIYELEHKKLYIYIYKICTKIEQPNISL